MRELCVALISVGILVLFHGCSDDEEPAVDHGVTQQDFGVTQQDFGVTQQDHGVTQQDQGVTKQDQGTTKQDGGTTKLDGAGPMPDGLAGANTGTICTPPQNVCPHPQDHCIIVGGGNQNLGMCLLQCTTKLAACPTADPSTQKSICFLEETGTTNIYCAYMCKYEGQTYACPTNSTCHAISGNTSVCVQ